MARKGILTTAINKPTSQPTGLAAQSTDKPAAKPAAPIARMRPRGAVGALQSSLTKLQENAVQEIDCALIDDAGYEDRLGLDSGAQRQLTESLRIYGQQVPVLLRPHPKQTGRYEIVYGRRRLQALKGLGQPVKALVRQLDDHALVMAQGQENTSRQDLSFIEKASFAAQLQEAGYERQTIAAALSIDQPMVSRMLKVGTAFPLPFLRQIGSAPGIGRERWMALAKARELAGGASRAAALMSRPEFLTLESDARFEAVLAAAETKPEAQVTPPARAKPRTLRSDDGKALADLRKTTKGLTLNIPSRTADGFDEWFNTHAEALVSELHNRWKDQRTDD
ncbi:plasmid partitioning protein RepB [Parasedimentitalea psychrophila]|uniref:Plasmid partitioning protein RepB n=1 Tax=Parasedimentitalea psychrophila TaxID=2997337 RepID=A0A9Y2P3J2_9RHOB|nr:plasmid partitioning protein RepB [Parasedimentitalea psychrophila]WIY27721.1 plasmid partitioning protein RepB [Parasedimentitalea psychrophila]